MGGDVTAMRDVRFYQVVGARCASDGAGNDGGDGRRGATAIGDLPAAAAATAAFAGGGRSEDRGGMMMAYVVSPSTRLILLPPDDDDDDDSDDGDGAILHPQLAGVVLAMRGCALRLPRPSSAISFLRSVAERELLLANASAGGGDSSRPAKKKGGTDASTSPMASAVVAEPAASTTANDYSSRRSRHPSANDIADALYLQGAIPAAHSSSFAARQPRVVRRDGGSTHPRIIHVIGKEENNVRACVDEACDIS
jgi:hypothetical protein